MEVIEERPKVKAGLGLGALVVAESKYTGFKTDAYEDHFVMLTKNELCIMGPGSTFYLKLDNFYPQGMVRGWVKVAIEKVEIGGDKDTHETRVYFTGGGKNGSRTTRRGHCKEFVRAIDEKKLLGIIESMPLSQIVFAPRS